MIIAAITPYLAFGNATPLIFDGLNTSLSLSAIFQLKKRALQLSSAQINYLITNR